MSGIGSWFGILGLSGIRRPGGHLLLRRGLLRFAGSVGTQHDKAYYDNMNNNAYG